MSDAGRFYVRRPSYEGGRVVSNGTSISLWGEAGLSAGRREWIDHDSICRKCFPSCQTTLITPNPWMMLPFGVLLA